MSSSREDIKRRTTISTERSRRSPRLSCDALTATEKQRLLARLETHRRRLPAVEHPLINQLGTACSRNLGAATLAEALAMGLRISKVEAKRRIAEAGTSAHAPRCRVNSSSLGCRLLRPVKSGKIGVEHIKVIREFLANLPDAIDYQTREESETTGQARCRIGSHRTARGRQ